jgi:uncharacterized membrane protein
MDDRTVTIILRLIHILAGVFWAGTAFLMAGFLIPTMRATGKEGGVFIQHLMRERRLHAVLGVAMLLTVLSGIAMYAKLAAAPMGRGRTLRRESPIALERWRQSSAGLWARSTVAPREGA